MKNAARAAEERARGSLKRASELTDESEEEPEEDYFDQTPPDISGNHATRSPSNPVLPVRSLLGNRRR